MNRFLQNWNYPKHAIAVFSIYTCICLLGNAMLAKKIPDDEKTCCPVKNYKNMTTKQKTFNGIVIGCMAFDMSVTYLIINHFKKQYK